MMEKELLLQREKRTIIGSSDQRAVRAGGRGGGAVSLYRVGVKSQEGKKEN